MQDSVVSTQVPFRMVPEVLDAAEGDYDHQTAIENRINLGLHPNGDFTQIYYDVLRAAGSFVQAQYGSGAPDYFALQENLQPLFPKRIPLATKLPK